MNARRCVRCRRPVRPQHRNEPRRADTMRGRGLCSHCYQTAWATGDLIDYPRATRSRNDLLDDYVILRAEGHTGQQIAQRLGMTYPAFERALQRARRDGDPRAAPDTPWRVREAS